MAPGDGRVRIEVPRGPLEVRRGADAPATHYAQRMFTTPFDCARAVERVRREVVAGD